MRSNVFLFWWATLAIKIVASAWLPMSSDEAYYWVWSQHLQMSYFDHPAMVAWLLKLGEPLLHWGRAVRWPSVILGHTTLLIWLKLLGDRLSNRQQIWFLLLGCTTPLLGAGSMLATPDVPLIFFWSCAIFCCDRALQTRKLYWYALLGAALGLGFCSKYQIVLFVPILFVYLSIESKWQEVKVSGLLCALVAGLAFCSPVLIWNWQNNFASFRFQLSHGLGAKVWKPSWTIEYLLAQLFLLFPTIFYLALRANRAPANRRLAYFAWGPLLFFLFTSFRGSVEANWPVVSYPAILALATLELELFAAAARWLTWTVSLWAGAATLLASNFIYPWMPLEAISSAYQAAQEYQGILEAVPRYQPIYAGNYQLASLLSFNAKRPIYKARGYSRHDFFDDLPESIPREKHYYIVVEKEQRFPQELSARGHREIDGFRIDRHHFIIEVVGP